MNEQKNNMNERTEQKNELNGTELSAMKLN